MPITTNVPLPNQSLATSQPLIQGNFVTIEAAFIQDHVDYGITGQGKHNQVTFPVQASAPSYLNGEVGLFNLLNSNTSADELYVAKGTNPGIAFTASLQNTNGWSYLPSGILLKWGTAGVSGSGNTTITFPTGATYPAFNSIYSVQISPVSTTSNQIGPKINMYGTTTITVYNPGSNAINVTYFAIGS